MITITCHVNKDSKFFSHLYFFPLFWYIYLTKKLWIAFIVIVVLSSLFFKNDMEIKPLQI